MFGRVDCQDTAKRQFDDELIAYADAFTKALYAPLISRVDMSDEAGKNSYYGVFISATIFQIKGMSLWIDSYRSNMHPLFVSCCSRQDRSCPVEVQ